MKNKGFTLVELAIVLIIIGLLITGALSGQQLIHQAQINRTISKIKEVDLALNTFKAKYGEDALPGDVAQSAQFGLDVDSNGNNNVAQAVTIPGQYLTRGNGKIEPFSYDNFDGEMANFWVHLSNAKLISGSYSQPSGCAGNCESVTGRSFPALPVGTGMVAFSSTLRGAGSAAALGLNYVLGIGSDKGNLGFVYPQVTGRQDSFQGATLTANESRFIDTKLDDGRPNGGNIRIVGPYTFGDLGPSLGMQGLFNVENDASFLCRCAAHPNEYFSNSSYCGTAENYNADRKICTISVKAGI